VFVVWRVRLEAAVEDTDELVRELPTADPAALISALLNEWPSSGSCAPIWVLATPSRRSKVLARWGTTLLARVIGRRGKRALSLESLALKEVPL
jgi:hypothetical protein